MSSLVDAVINSDNRNTDLPSATELERKKRNERLRLQRSSPRPRSSSRPRGPPSESAGAQSDIDGYLDNELPAIRAAMRRLGHGPRPDVPRVVDTIGETIARRFEDFLEKSDRPVRIKNLDTKPWTVTL